MEDIEEVKEKDAYSFADALKKAKLKDGGVYFGTMFLKAEKGVKDRIQYNEDGLDILQNKHEYTFKLVQGDVQLSLQLYRNINDHYRLFAYTKFGSAKGMTFSVNLTTQKETNNIIYLTQKIKFGEQYKGDEKLAEAHRRRKQIVLGGILAKLGLTVTDNSDVVLGIFDPVKGKFADTSAGSFLNSFIATALLKGHFQGNKGYQLDLLPSFTIREEFYASNEDESLLEIPTRLKNQKTRRNIPLGLRYKVLTRDKNKCVKCGYGVNEGALLHVDHKTPYSLGGLTVFEDLQTLCQKCNIGKSNKYID